MLKLYNTLSKTVEEFSPINPPRVGLYTCGPTVYDYPHIGHGRKYVMDDVLKRTLMNAGFTVNHVQNVTDVGHLVSDSDEGEDKLEKGAKREGKTVWDIAAFYEREFYTDMDALGIMRPTTICRATEHINEQIELVQTLLKKGHAYETSEAVYFDVSTFAEYGKLFGQNIEDKYAAVREEVQTGEHKKHPADFALWFKRVGRFADHAMHWNSPWGEGFPGWHIECSAMSMHYLGDTIDIHTGGIDHIPIHHPNEIAQSEGATGKPFVRFWVHHAFLKVDGEKMSKSKGNYYRLKDIREKGFHPMDLRYLFLTTHYRKTLNFTWEGMAAAREARIKLQNHLAKLVVASKERRTILSHEKLEKVDSLRSAFEESLASDLNTPQALAVVWSVVKSNIPPNDKYDLIVSFDEILGLHLKESSLADIQTVEMETPKNILDLADMRKRYRKEKKWKEADDCRRLIDEAGYTVEDMSDGGFMLTKK